MKKIVITGDSLAAGTGWDKNDLLKHAKDEPLLWTNLCHKNIKRFQNLSLVNVSKNGSSNADIFQTAVRAISIHNSNIDTLFCEWTIAPRYNFNVGFEMWDTSESLRDTKIRNHNVKLSNGDQWSREYIRDLCNRLKVMHHLHWEILRIVDYSNILSNLAKDRKIGIFFINGICPWDKDYFLELHNVKPEEYTFFTKKNILDIDSRTDEDIHKLYHQAHQHYREVGGINELQWINLYKSFEDLTTDVNFDNLHPGKQSNQHFFEIIKSRLESLNYI